MTTQNAFFLTKNSLYCTVYFMEKFYSTGEVAKRLNKSREMIYRYIKQGKLVPDAQSGNEILFRELTIQNFEQVYTRERKNNGRK